MFFFFKQKTAYEMRISDWSSDVCSSDLELGAALQSAQARRVGRGDVDHQVVGHRPQRRRAQHIVADRVDRIAVLAEIDADRSRGRARIAEGSQPARSEEHTSELQSLMRISYAVLCLKKKTKSLIRSHT